MAEPAEIRLSGRLEGPLADAILEAARAARMGVVVTLVDGDEPRNVYANDACAEMLGYARDELFARGPFALVLPEELDRMKERYAKRAAGEVGPYSFEVAMRHKDGSVVYAEVTTTNVTLDGRRATISFIHDATEKRRAREALERSEETFRQLIEAAPEAIGIMRDGHFIYANQAYVDMLGYETRDEFYAQRLRDFIHPEDVEVLAAREHKVTHGGRLAPQLYRAIRKDGTEVLVEVSSVAFEYQGKQAILGIGRDVTERRRMEAQLIQADRLAALGTLAAGVAHEVNNPLAYLLLNLEWLARQLPELARHPSRLPELAAMLEEARQGADRVGQIVRELRQFSRPDGETRRRVDLRHAVTSAIRIASHEIRHRARVVTALEDVAPVWANEARIEQVLLNLLLNAAQAMPETRGDINEIRISVRNEDATHVAVEVSDNGVGIPPEMVRRIFDPFFTTKPVGIGTGLGLSICHTIVTSLGGEIRVASQVGEGTTFLIRLPAAGDDQTASSASEPASTDLRARHRARVLVVDDEVSIANTLKDLLSPDHDVWAVESARAALEIIREKGEFDVVFCDLMMPEMTGMDLFDAVKSLHPGFERRIVFMTGGAFTPRAAEFLATVTNARLEKPFALSAVEKLVRDAANARAAAARAA